MDRPKTSLSDSALKTKAEDVNFDFGRHKFRPGEYYDKYLFKILRKHEINYEEYRFGLHLLSRERVIEEPTLEDKTSEHIQNTGVAA